VGLRLSRAGQVVLALTVAAAALRFATLGVQSIWLDESATMILVRRGFTGMLSHLSASESAPPLYYVMAWAWTKVFGVGVLGFRSFSALIGTLTIPVMYLAGRRVSERVGLWAAALAVVNPAMYYYSQEARCYALLILLSAVAFVFWQRALQTPDRRSLTLWAGASILAILTHYFAAFLFIPEAILLARRTGLRRLLVPGGAVVIVGLALMPLAVAEHGNGHKSEWIEESSLISRVAETAKQFLVGLYSPLEIFTALVGGLLAAGAIVLVIRRSSQAERGVAREVAIVAASALALPLLLALTHALDVFDGRNMIADWVPTAVLISIGLGASGARRAGPLIGLCLCALFLGVVVSVNLIPGYQRDNWRGAAQALPAQRMADRIVVAEAYSWYPLSIYLPGAQPLTGTTVSTRELDFITLRTRRTGRSPTAPVTVTQPPHGFHLVSIRQTESYAVSRYVAPRTTTVTLATLRRAVQEPYAEAIQQR
jgi:mannosyltransferase